MYNNICVIYGWVLYSYSMSRQQEECLGYIHFLELVNITDIGKCKNFTQIPKKQNL